MAISNNIYSVFSLLPMGTMTRVSVNTEQVLTPPTGASILLIQADVGSVRYTIDEATSPTADIGFLLEATDAVERLDLYELCTVRVIGTGAFVNYQWARPAANLF